MAHRTQPRPPSSGPATPQARPPITPTPTDSCSIVPLLSLHTANPALPSRPKAPWPDPRPLIAFRKIPGGYEPFSFPYLCPRGSLNHCMNGGIFSYITLLHSCHGLSVKGLTLVGFYDLLSDLKCGNWSGIPNFFCGSIANSIDDLWI